MPVFLQHRELHYCWAVWKIEETADELLAMLPHADTYAQEARRFASESRRLEWLTARVLLYAMLGKEKRIAYYPNGRPYLPDDPRHISISHTKGYVAVILGENPLSGVGIDIEQYGERVRRVADRFVRDDEIIHSYKDTDIWALLLHWSAKETVYKCLDESEVDFREHLHVMSFILGEKGTFDVCEYRTSRKRKYVVHYLLHLKFVLTWTCFY